MAMIGYARENRAGAAFEHQLVRLKACDRIFQEVVPITNEHRPRWAACLAYLRPGDTIVVCRFAVIAGSLPMLSEVLTELKRRMISVQVLDIPLEAADLQDADLGAFVAMLVELEMTHRGERQREGIRLARERGIRSGRRPQLGPDQQKELWQLHRAGTPMTRLTEHFGLSRATLYHYLRLRKSTTDTQNHGRRSAHGMRNEGAEEQEPLER